MQKLGKTAWESAQNLEAQVLLTPLTLCEIFWGHWPPLLKKLIFLNLYENYPLMDSTIFILSISYNH
jgi:hypothetical protein